MSWLDLTEEQRSWVLSHDNTDYAGKPEDIKCPWCDTVQQLEYDQVSYEDDNSVTMTCWYDVCGKEFEVRTSVTYDWITELPEEYLIEQAKKELPNE